MPNHASARFWSHYPALPERVREVADQAFALFENEPQHPSLHFKKIGRFWSARVGRHHRALAIEVDDGLLWVWIGPHDDYDRLLRDA